MKPRYIIGAVVAIAFVVIGFFALDKTGIQYTDLQTAESLNKKVQIKGVWVKEKGANYDTKSNVFTFTMRDDNNRLMPVVYHGARPNNFDIAESIVVKGRVVSNKFEATDILTKCPSKYEGNAEQIEKMKKQSSGS